MSERESLFDSLHALAEAWDCDAAELRQWEAEHPDQRVAGRHAASRACGLQDAAMSLRLLLERVK